MESLTAAVTSSVIAGSGYASFVPAWAPQAGWPVANVWEKRDVPGLVADMQMTLNVAPASSQFFSFTPEEGADKVYVTINTCLQPQFASATDQLNPPQLALTVSTSSLVDQPTPADNGTNGVVSVHLVEGYGSITLNATKEVFIGVTGGNVTTVGTQPWNMNIAASSTAPYHSWVNSSNVLSMVDSDTAAVLLITQNLTALVPANQTEEEWIAAGHALSVFVRNTNDTRTNGIKHSYCGLSQAQHGTAASVEVSLSNYFGATSIQQQFYATGLNASSTYLGFLATPPNITESIVGGGGTVYSPMTFATKQFANCAVIYGLSFCDSVAYAVPANPDTYDVAALAALYDNTTQINYQNFVYSLQQIACNTSSSAQYSLAKNCTDCELAYKQWLCAVSIPRCADWTPNPMTESQQYLFPRNAAQKPIAATPDIVPVMNSTLLDRLAYNSSRNNATIAGMIMPGPYSEILPCENLCYELVRSCPAALGFACPYRGMGLELSYGPQVAVPGGGLSCSQPGSVYGVNGVGRLGLRMANWMLLSVMITIWAAVAA